MSEELAGKVAIVTGAARGLGRGIAELFVEEGASVVIADLRDEEGEALAASLGSKARYLRTDVSSEAEVQALIDFTVGEFGRLDAIVNNAGITEPSFGRLIDASFAAFEPIMKVKTEMGTYATAPGEAPEKARRIAEAVGAVRMGFQPLKRLATPRDIGEAALWLISDRSPQVTGQVVSVDGGATIGDVRSQIGEIMAARAEVEAEFG
jgi:NAD(P)-dependent dehydrogenase (short-subunit alcohol dehydrogenase family)